MADLVVDAAQSYDPSASSILNKLPGKRIDAYIREVASRGIPQQGEQTGGYTQAYAHLSHLPLFPLYSDEQLKIMAKKWGDTSNLHDFGSKDVDIKTKLTFKAMEHMAGGGGTVSTVRWMGRTVGGLETLAASMAVEQNELVVMTRWIVPTQQGVPWFVDMLEYRCVDPNCARGKIAKILGNKISLIPGLPTDRKVTFKMSGIEAKGVKSQKTWSKKRGIEGSCDAIVLVDGGAEVSLEIVARIQRLSSIVEVQEIDKRFEKQWRVPVLR